jgi:hypothetical protein
MEAYYFEYALQIRSINDGSPLCGECPLLLDALSSIYIYDFNITFLMVRVRHHATKKKKERVNLRLCFRKRSKNLGKEEERKKQGENTTRLIIDYVI